MYKSNSVSQVVLEALHMLHGWEIDLDEGWFKLVSRQFAGHPARAIGELIANAIDSYGSGVKWADRRFEIKATDTSVSLTDWGEGMSTERIRLLLTLGGTDKAGDPSRIGRFGLGFFSCMNPRLGTTRVRVTTRCQGHGVEVVFTVKEPGKRPLISARVLPKPPEHSTCIEVEFDNRTSAADCLRVARERLRYCPCPVLIDGERNDSVWQRARRAKDFFFERGSCDGFIESSSWGSPVTLLCKYEHVGTWDTPDLVRDNTDCDGDLRTLARKEVPFVPGIAITLNAPRLNLTVGRDRFYLDPAADAMVKSLGSALISYLDANLRPGEQTQVVLANQYILRYRIKRHLSAEGPADGSQEKEEKGLLRKLVEARVYRINGRRDLFSLQQVAGMRSAGTPLFFSPNQTNLRWLDGAFRHDFVLLCPQCQAGGGAPNFYDDLLGGIFDDVVNLDTIRDNTARIGELVRRGIVDRKALSPTYQIIGERGLTPAEAMFAQEITELLQHPEIRSAISRNLHFSIKKIRCVFFDIEEGGLTVATGLFDEGTGAAITGETAEGRRGGRPSALTADKTEDWASDDETGTVLLGLRRGHPLLDRLLLSEDDPYRTYYALTFLSHQLALSQKLLVPYSPFYNWVKEQLAADMRRVLMRRLVLSCVQGSRTESQSKPSEEQPGRRDGPEDSGTLTGTRG